jgi:hypothetical protein
VFHRELIIGFYNPQKKETNFFGIGEKFHLMSACVAALVSTPTLCTPDESCFLSLSLKIFSSF